MSGPSDEEVEKTLTRYWGRPARAASADLDVLWSAAAGHGWFDLGGSLETALRVVRGTGRFACPLPVLDAFVAADVLAARPDLTIAMAADAVRVVLAGPAPGPPLAEAGSTATHVLELPAAAGEAVLRPIEEATPAVGLAAPPWYRIVTGEPAETVPVSEETAARLTTLRRLGLAARALGAAERAHELALAHARTRRQFGKAVGGFGAVQQRLVDCHIELAGAAALVTEAGKRHGDACGPAAARLAVAQVLRVAPRVQSAAHRTLAAAGYFEEHDAPWLFRRLHADLAWLPALRPAGDDVADLPDPLLPPAAEAARAEFRRFLASVGPVPEAIEPRPDDPATVGALAAGGWLSMGWPVHAGGRDAGPDESVAVQYEILRRRLPVTAAVAVAATVGTAIARYGTPAQRDLMLPAIARGECQVAAAYSEPDAGSDLAALATTAERDGPDWLITGRKAWCSEAHRARYLWLAARTEPSGITLFLIPADLPGIAIRPYVALSSQVACDITLEAVRVPDSARVGPAGGGWEVLTDVLGGERAVLGAMAASAQAVLDDLVAALGPRASAENVRPTLTEFAARVQAARLLAVAANMPTGSSRRAGAARLTSAAKVAASEVIEDLSLAALGLLGPSAALPGPLESALRLAPGGIIAGGTNDVHRGLIARTLGLPPA
ncbi:acyl-CoA dehydrogenase family protein [Phytohabitans suffuscus]|uniref:Acyl-CoA dehydrogenase n=1 Tax=Phytohabitans suffuscus TaxID=624315 RepID=A0A6F8YF49_9ACTN|nr:acyl-CoA dehydrogenase family protein [Phytohabitans suffuscus]BCB84571.1 acyl-CoA dehydrogenase [Phytohabitans suffuscus]